MRWSRAFSLACEVALIRPHRRRSGRRKAPRPPSLPPFPASSRLVSSSSAAAANCCCCRGKEGSNERDAGSPRRDKDHITTKTRKKPPQKEKEKTQIKKEKKSISLLQLHTPLDPLPQLLPGVLTSAYFRNLLTTSSTIFRSLTSALRAHLALSARPLSHALSLLASSPIHPSIHLSRARSSSLSVCLSVFSRVVLCCVGLCCLVSSSRVTSSPGVCVCLVSLDPEPTESCGYLVIESVLRTVKGRGFGARLLLRVKEKRTAPQEWSRARSVKLKSLRAGKSRVG